MPTSHEKPRFPWQNTGPRHPSGMGSRASWPELVHTDVRIGDGCTWTQPVCGLQDIPSRGVLCLRDGKQGQAAPPSPSPNTKGRGCSALPATSFRVCATPSLHGILLLSQLHPFSCGHQRGRQGTRSICRLLEAVPYGTCLLQWDALTPTSTLIPLHPLLCSCPRAYRAGHVFAQKQVTGWKAPA